MFLHNNIIHNEKIMIFFDISLKMTETNYQQNKKQKIKDKDND